jgi:hypothetical protein
MDIDALSVSKINTNKDCPWKLALTYHIKHPDLRKPTIYTEKGIAVHEVLEKYANGEKNYEDNLKQYYRKSKLWELDQRNPDKGGFPHPQPKVCEACPYNLNGHCDLADKPIGEFPGCPLPNFQDDLELAAKVVNREGDNNVFQTREILGAEVEFDVMIEGVRVKGVIDLVTKVDEETLEIIDYKTGRHAKTSSTIRDDPQVRIYSLVAKMIWPQFKYRLMTLDYLRKRPISVAFGDEDDELTVKAILRQDRDIRANASPQPLSRESWLCRFCIGFERCHEMHDSLKVGGKFKLPEISCVYKNEHQECYGSFSCDNGKDLTSNNLRQLMYACSGHKEVYNGGLYKPEEKPEAVQAAAPATPTFKSEEPPDSD